MDKLNKKQIKNCSTCAWLDEYFGDCCAPKSDGCKGVMKAINGCANNNYAWWKKSKTVEQK